MSKVATKTARLPGAAQMYGEVLEALWRPLKFTKDGVVDIDTMVIEAIRPNGSFQSDVVLENDEKAALKAESENISASPWNTESRRRFLIAGALGEALARRAIKMCGQHATDSDRVSMSDDICMLACQAARNIDKTGQLGAVLASVMLMPEVKYAKVHDAYAHDPWMVSGYFQVPLDGVDLRAEWDRPYKA